MLKPGLSVIIPCLNGAKTIDLQLSALARQKCDEPWELIVVNNGSTDDTVKIAESYRNKFSNFRIVDASDKQGLSYTRNVGVLNAQSDAVAFCDADDKVHDGWVASMLAALKEHNLVAGKIRLIELNKPWRVPDYHHFETKKSIHKDVFSYPHAPHLKYASGCNLGVRKEVHFAIGGFDEGIPFNQDKDYCIRAQKANYSLYFNPDAVIEYRLKHSLWGSFKQYYRWSRYSVLIFRRNVTPISAKQKLRFLFGGWRYIPSKLVKIRKLSDLYNFVSYLGARFGEVHGCFEYLLFENVENEEIGSPSIAIHAMNKSPDEPCSGERFASVNKE